jgi:Fe2+ or Zn2+ uptake regulation protein
MAASLETRMSVDVPQLFAQRGLRCTRQRKAVYEALLATTAHPTADDLFKSVAPIIAGLSLATVYNTLEALCESGLALKLAPNALPGTGATSARYDATTDDHMHVRDQHTGQVADVPMELSQQILDAIPQHLVRQIERRLNFKLHHIHLELVGDFESSTDSN